MCRGFHVDQRSLAFNVSRESLFADADRSWRRAGREPARYRCGRAERSRASERLPQMLGRNLVGAAPSLVRTRRRARLRLGASAIRSRSRLTRAGWPAPAADSANRASAANSSGSPTPFCADSAYSAATGAMSALVPTVHSGAPGGGSSGATSGATSQSTRSARAISASARRTPSASARLSVSRSRPCRRGSPAATEIELNFAHIARGAGLIADDGKVGLASALSSDWTCRHWAGRPAPRANPRARCGRADRFYERAFRSRPRAHSIG